jgi:ComF family protein
MKHLFTYLLKSLVDFIYPPTCLLCEEKCEENGPLCPSCTDEISNSVHPTVQKGKKDFQHLSGEIFFDCVVTCWDYTPKILQLIHRMKYRRGRKLGYFLGDIAGRALGSCLDECNEGLVIPVPLHRVRRRERGFNQSEVICRGLIEYLPVQLYPDILTRKRNTSSQTKLSAEERQRNVKNAFTIKQSNIISEKRILIVDDVCTTGATLNSCASVLKKSGAKNVTGVALSRPMME